MSIAYVGFICLGLVVVVAITVWLCTSYRSAKRKRLAMQQQSSVEGPSPLQERHDPDEFDYYYGQNLNGGTRYGQRNLIYPNGDMYYNTDPSGSAASPGGQPVVPAVVVSIRQTPQVARYPQAQPAPGMGMPYGAQDEGIGGGGSVYGEAEYLPAASVHRETSAVGTAPDATAAQAGAEPATEAKKGKKPLVAEVAKEEVEVEEVTNEPTGSTAVVVNDTEGEKHNNHSNSKKKKKTAK